MENKELLISSMTMISQSGDGRDIIQQALDSARNSEFIKADGLLSDAFEKLKVAHREQTKVLQNAMKQEDEESARLLFSHAQDTLMTINSEYYLAKQIVACMKDLYARMEQLEAKTNEQ